MRRVGLLCSAVLAVLSSLCCQGPAPGDAASPATPPAPPPAVFTDVTAQAGVGFVHVNGATERRFLPETMGAGVAVFDYDGDDWPDLYFVNGTPVASLHNGGSAAGTPSGALYRNLHDGRFEEVTAAAGLDAPFLGMGAAVGDLDNDGDSDLFVSGVGGDHLFRNTGGVFDDVTVSYGLTDRGFGSSAAFIDFDRDGWLDLFVGRYVTWSAADDRHCKPDGEHPSYCTPEVYDGASNLLYRNLDGERFVDVTRAAGVSLPEGKTLGVVALDHNDDAWPDLAVANDTTRNFLFENQRDGTFREIGVEAGVAYSPSGSTRGGMGIDAGDLDGDAHAEVVVGNFAQEMTAIYRPAGGGGPFRDDAAQLGVGVPSLMTLAFGTLLFDYDSDGWLDLLLVNGHIEPTIARFQPQQSHAQPPALFHNLATPEGFEQVTGGVVDEPLVGRGLAAGDLDRDGDLDLVVTQNGGAARILRNDAPSRSWLRLELQSRTGGGTPYGARVTAWAGGKPLTRSLVSGRSYLSACEPLLLIGLGDARVVERLEIVWPSGRVQTLHEVPVDAPLAVDEPSETVPPKAPGSS